MDLLTALGGRNMPHHHDHVTVVDSSLARAERICDSIRDRRCGNNTVATSRFEVERVLAALRDGVRDQPCPAAPASH